MRWRGFYVGPAQRVAALLLLALFAECCWTIAHTSLTAEDYRYARCGSEMWQRPGALEGYFTTCGNLNGDGTLAYRIASLPLLLERDALLAFDHFRRPQNRRYADGSLNGSLWEVRSELTLGPWLLRLPFTLFAVWLGGGLWWVAKRLFGTEGGALALALYVFCPAVIHYAVHPNNEVLTMWGLYGMVYTFMGVAHALQGPRSKWKFRILLLTAALGLTACAHLLAAGIGLIAGTAFCMYLAERNRGYVMQIAFFALFGAALIVFASFSFRPSAFQYVFTGGSGRFWFSTGAVRLFAGSLANAASSPLPPWLSSSMSASGAAATSATLRRCSWCRPLALVYTTQITTAPWFWSLPFVFTFIGGVFADALQTTSRRMFLALSAGVVLAQALLCWAWMAGRLG